MSKLPLVVILGSTGSGKTKLSLELAKKFGGEVIGADSMQVYKCLDIVTAKATKEEMASVKHHMIDILEPSETFTVLDYRNRTLSIINDLKAKEKLPIIVGGTNYYIESLLWKILVEDNITNCPGVLDNRDHELESSQLHKKLKLLDPDMAKRLHPNNKRKILRALEVLYKKGRKLSDILLEQKESSGGSTYGGALRFPEALILWLRCQREILDQRLDNRVDKMLEEGLISELESFYSDIKLKQEVPDYTKGVFQSIGFKEFHNYLMLDEEERKSEEGLKQLKLGLEQLKLVTRRYSRKQDKWVNNRFLTRSDRQVPPVFALDTSEVEKWEDNVEKPAFQIIQAFIEGKQSPVEPLKRRETSARSNLEDDTFECQDCQRVFIGEFQFNLHLNSRKHRKQLEYNKKRQE